MFGINTDVTNVISLPPLSIFTVLGHKSIANNVAVESIVTLATVVFW